MATLPLPSVLVALGANAPSVEPDGELLARFASSADEAAFAAVVRRYARLVWRVARTRCRTESTAEEVFQATFVVLARKASSIRSEAALPGWLHRTAHRLAVKAARRDRPAAPLPTDIPVSADPLDTLSARELLAAVDDEMAKLSDAERSVLVLCGLEHHSLDEVAVRLGCTVGSVKGRLERSRAKLRARLDARGLTLPAVALAVFSGPPARAVEAAVTLSGGLVPPAVEQLLSGGTHMTRRFVALGLVAVLVAGGVGSGFGFLPHNGPAATAAPVPKALKPRPVEAWGEPIDGLQAGLRMPGGAVVESGQTAELQVVVRNVSRKPIEVTFTAQQQGVFVLGENKDGEVRLSWGVYVNGIPPQPQVHTLAPGVEFVRWQVQVRHSPEDDKTPPGSHVDLPAGTYRFHMDNVGSDVMLRGYFDKLLPLDFLATGTLEVLLPEPQLIKAPVPKEKASPVVWSESIKADWQASRAERLAGAWTPDGKSVLVPSPTVVEQNEKVDFGGVDVRDAATGKVTKRLAFKPNGKLDQIFLPQSLAVSPDGKTVYASGSVYGPSGKGEAARGLVTWKDASTDDAPEVAISADPTADPIALSPDGKQLAVVAGRTVDLLDTPTGKALWRCNLGGGKRGPLAALAFNPADGTLAVGTGTGEWVALKGKTGQTLHVVGDLGLSVRSAIASADGVNLAFGGDAVQGGQALVLFTGKEVHKLAAAVPEKVSINGLAFSPDGKHLAAACSDGEVRVFDATTGKAVAAAREHKETVFSVAFSPDGKKLLTVGRDAVKVWEVERLLKAK